MDVESTNLDKLLTEMETDAWGEQLRQRFRAASVGLSDPGPIALPWHNGRPHAQRLQDMRPSPRYRRLLSTKALALAAAGLVMALGFVLTTLASPRWRLRPETISAKEVIQRVQSAATSPPLGGMNSFSLVEDAGPMGFVVAPRQGTGAPSLPDSSQAQGVSFSARSEFKEWFQAPDRWRTESRSPVPNNFASPSGSAGGVTTLTISDGTDVWSYVQPAYGTNGGTSPAAPVVYVHSRAPNEGPASPFGALTLLFQESNNDLSALLARASDCYNPKLLGNGKVAGRTVYVIDFGASKCPSDLKVTAGRRLLWVDKQTYFVLKQQQYSGVDGSLFSATEVRSVQYNPSLDSSLFAFTPPPGVEVQPGPPAPAPRAGAGLAPPEPTTR